MYDVSALYVNVRDALNKCLYEITAIAPIRELAERLARKMQQLNNGRQFMSAHMRRGDCEYF